MSPGIWRQACCCGVTGIWIAYCVTEGSMHKVYAVDVSRSTHYVYYVDEFVHLYSYYINIAHSSNGALAITVDAEKNYVAGNTPWVLTSSDGVNWTSEQVDVVGSISAPTNYPIEFYGESPGLVYVSGFDTYYTTDFVGTEGEWTGLRGGGTTYYPQLAYDSNGVPHVIAKIGNWLKHAYKPNDTWIIDLYSTLYWNNNFAIGPDNKLHWTYIDQDSGDLYETVVSGTVATNRLIWPGITNAGAYPNCEVDIIVDSNGLTHVGGNTKVTDGIEYRRLFHAVGSGSTWSREVIEEYTDPYINSVFGNSCIALDGDNNPYIMFTGYDLSSVYSQLLYYKKGDSWDSFTVVDGTGGGLNITIIGGRSYSAI